jgi:putative oxidoreductase
MTSTTTNGSLDGAAVPRRRRIGRYALLALRVLLAVEFAGSGLMKLAGVDQMVTLFDDIGAGQWLRIVVGVLEVAGGVGLLVPGVAGLAAAGLAVLMAGAFLTHATVLEGVPVIEAVFLAGVLVVAVARRADIRRLRGGGGTR